MADGLNRKQALDLTAMAMLVVLCASWALQQVTIKVANHGVSPILQSGIRSVGATVLVLIWMALRQEPMLERDGTLWWGTAAGLLFGVEFLLIYRGLELTHASRAVIFLYTSPFVVALGALLFIPGEHADDPGRWSMLCLCGHRRRVQGVAELSHLSHVDR